MWKEITAYRNVFRQFDKDKSNVVDGYELQTMFSKIGFPIEKSLVTSILRRYGGRTGTLSLDTFIIVICKLVFMFSIFQDHKSKTRQNSKADIAEFTRSEMKKTCQKELTCNRLLNRPSGSYSQFSKACTVISKHITIFIISFLS
ncbi:hypothetical protein LOTGIDRAFT_229683 [Lottia gigantea]|uniref:EF-hand domain-containing protein n=1 Tax=Lottia gigantea TaxID=225164 RepID=V4B6P0_LOTGI|nr:hypothetical protein LOTGIDRAFT_229683 [Lottia gigantea]ESO84224.1 hypothetical protein LOTGIDRAFT_229683 [Lottia gigantea]